MEDKNVFTNKLIILLYFVVAFIPSLGAHEIVNTQWFYIAILNTLSLGFVFFKRNEYDLTLSKLSVYVFVGAFVFMLIAVLSITKSLLVSESIITLSYLVITIIALLVFYIIIKQNAKEYFYFFTFMIASIGLIESLQVINYFVTHNNEIRSAELLKALPHNYGNRNILAISIAMKFPFVFYLFIRRGFLLKLLFLIMLTCGMISVLLIGTRTAIFGSLVVIVTMLLYQFFITTEYIKKLKVEILPIFFIVILSLVISLSLNKIRGKSLNTINDLTFVKYKKSLVYKRSIVLDKNNKTNDLIDDSGRGEYWKAAIEDIKQSPFLGIGIGNWKVMAKDELVYNTGKKNYFYPKRVHNDFLQVFSEIGVVGFLIYITLFIVTLFVLLKIIFINLKKSKKEEAFIAVILLASLLIYFLDSLFNFPHERTPIQILTFFILALVLSLKQNKVHFKFKKVPVFIGVMVLSFVFLIVTFKNYQASKIHKILYTDFIGKDFFQEKYNISYEKAVAMLPEFPELDAYGRATDIMRAFYAYNSEQKEKAIFHLDGAIEDGPYHAEPYGVKALIYFQDKDLQNKDSALYYAKKSFEIQPSKQQSFEILRRIYADQNDTINLINTLNTYLNVAPKDVDAWIKKAEHLYVYKKGYDRFLEVIDSAYNLNPRDEKIIAYRKKQSRFKDEEKQTKLANNVLVEKHYNLGIKYFNQKKYNKARVEFHKVLKLDASNMATLVNLGVMERVSKNYKKSIEYLTKVVNANFMKNGQPEYNIGLCYYKLGDNEKALKSLELSRLKGYKSAQKVIDKIIQ